VSKKEISESAQRRKQAREQRKQQQQGSKEDPRMSAARAPSAQLVTEAPSTAGRASPSISFSVSSPGAQVRIGGGGAISFLADEEDMDASDQELRQLEKQNEAAAARLSRLARQQPRAATLDFSTDGSSMLVQPGASAAGAAKATSSRRSARSSEWGRKASARSSGGRSSGRDLGSGAMGKLMSSAGGVELLSGDQEKELAVLVQDCMQIERAIEALAKELSRPPTDAEVAQSMGQTLRCASGHGGALTLSALPAERGCKGPPPPSGVAPPHTHPHAAPHAALPRAGTTPCAPRWPAWPRTP
jgi:hypothetical protein